MTQIFLLFLFCLSGWQFLKSIPVMLNPKERRKRPWVRIKYQVCGLTATALGVLGAHAYFTAPQLLEIEGLVSKGGTITLMVIAVIAVLSVIVLLSLILSQVTISPRRPDPQEQQQRGNRRSSGSSNNRRRRRRTT
jgi:hypothetical protein